MSAGDHNQQPPSIPQEAVLMKQTRPIRNVRPGERGLTLVELIITVTILSILA
jgi:prepilin-type N-terminal cleavage/methylation domain-containing protein